ncbi:MAG: hypothetical protein ACOYCD_00255 [Kiritimatiellia bacterium]|jgi:hypothetical protein
MKKVFLGVFLGAVIAFGLLLVVFFAMPSERRLSDLHTTGFRLADRSSVLYFAKYLPDTLSPESFAGVVIIDTNLSVIASRILPPELLHGEELIIEADKARERLQVRNSTSQVAVRWSVGSQEFELCTNALENPLENAQLILKSIRAR